MMSTKKVMALILGVMILDFMMSGCIKSKNTQAPASNAAPKQTSSSTEKGKTVKIGFYGSISGVNSESGRQGTLAVKAAEKYINENGGIKSLGGMKVETVMIDSTSDVPQGALPLERALSNGEIVAVVGSSQSAFALTSLPILEKYKVPAVTGSAANGDITKKGSNFIFQPAAIAATFSTMQIEFLKYVAEQMKKDWKELKVGIVYENSAWGEDNAKAQRKDLTAAGIKIAVDENYAAGALTDASPIVTKLKNAGVDVLFPSCYANDAKLIVTAMNSMKYKPIIVAGGSAFTWPSLLKDLGNDVNGITSADGWVWDCKTTLDNPEFTKIREEYEKTNNEFIPGQGGPTIISYMLIKEALENAGKADSVAVRDELRKLNAQNSKWFASLNNGKGKFDEKGFNPNGVPIILQWQDNKPRCVFPADAASSKLLNPLTNKPF